MVSSGPKERQKQFQLSSLLTWVIIAAFILVLLGSYGSRHYAKWKFTQLPDNDDALVEWLEGEKRQENVLVKREGDGILKIHMDRAHLLDTRKLKAGNVPTPDWDQLGYEGAQFQGGGYQSGFAMFGWSGIILAAVVCFSLIFALNWFQQTKSMK